VIVSRAERRRARSGRARELFGDDAEVALDVLELAGLAWHDCYRGVTPPDAVFEDMCRSADRSVTNSR